jgi:hypothetical protein
MIPDLYHALAAVGHQDFAGGTTPDRTKKKGAETISAPFAYEVRAV